mgnify:CR=1 FL=1
MEKIIFFGLIIPNLIFVVYLGGRAIMTGFSAKSSNRSDSEIKIDDDQENLSSELEKLNELIKSDNLKKEKLKKKKKKILDN